MVPYSEGGLVRPEDVFRKGEYPDETLLAEPVEEVLLLGMPKIMEKQRIFE